MIHLAGCSLFLSQKQDFSNHHLAQILITPNQEWTMEMWDEVLSSVSSVGTQVMDTSWNQVSDLTDIEFYRENDQLDADAVLKPGKDATFSPSTSNVFEMGSMAENQILIDEEQEKKNAPHPTHPITPVSKRLTQPLF